MRLSTRRFPSLKTRSGIMRFLHVVVLITYSVVNIIYSYRSFNRATRGADNVMDLIKNMRTGAILDIDVKAVCPVGYEEAFNYTWPGTQEGCWCGKANPIHRENYNSTHLSWGPCSKSQLNKGCTSVNGFNSTLVDSYSKLGNEQVRLCLLRSNETWADVAPVSGATCKDPNATKCGSSPENIFCTKQKKCPISSVQIVKLDVSLDSLTLASCVYDSGCIMIQRDGKQVRSLKFKRGDVKDSLPTAQFMMSEYSVCDSIFQENITPGRREFELLKQHRKTCGREGEELWKKLDNISETNLFKQNNLKPVIDYLTPYGYYPANKSGDDYIWGLWARSYIPWSLDCRDKIATFIARSENVRTFKLAQYLQLLTNIVMGIILGVFTSLLIFCNTFPYFTKVLNYLGKLLQAPVQILATVLATTIGGFYLTLVKEGCSSLPVLKVIQTASEEMKAARNDNLVGLIALGVAIAFDILFAIVRFQQKKEEYLIQNDTAQKIEMQSNQRRDIITL